MNAKTEDTSGGAAAVAQIECGESHTVLLTDEGYMYTWGANDKFQLGRTAQGLSDVDTKPGMVTTIKKQDGKLMPCIQIACGSHHTLALTIEGQIYSWGCGKSGQLGLPHTYFEAGANMVL